MAAPLGPSDSVQLAPDPQTFLPGLALALAIGLLIGIERGWQLRDEPAGSRVAGVRTFSLMGLFGGLAGLAVPGPIQLIFIVLLVAAAAAIVVGYFLDAKRDGNVSATSALASVLTIALGACASAGYMAVAAVGAGVAVILLASREPLHQALTEASKSDIRALVRLVLVVFVILPLLPDAPLGPYEINPRRVWTVVVITGSISFIGYVLIRVLGGRRGILITAVVGALVSSTAVTLECARRIRAKEGVSANQAGIAIASTIMMLRACVLVALLTPYILSAFLNLLIAALIISAAMSVLLLFWGGGKDAPFDKAALKPPDLKLALLFGGLVAILALAAGWAERQMQGSGAAVVALGGLFDVDSAIAALGTIPPNTLSVQLASFAVAAPVIFNSFLKLALTVGIVRSRAALLPSLALGVPAMAILTAVAIAAVDP